MKEKKFTRTCLMASLLFFLSASLSLAAGPDWGAPGGASPARPGSQNAAPSLKPAVDPKNCPTCLPNGTKTSVSGNQLFLTGENGKATLAKDGSYKLQDGSTIVITKGRITGQQPRSNPDALKPMVGPGMPTDSIGGTGKSPLTAIGGSKTSGKKGIKGITDGRKKRIVKPGSQVSGSDDEDLEDLEVQR